MSHAYALGDVIFPVNGNTAGVEFQILTAPTGPSGGTEPTWSTLHNDLYRWWRHMDQYRQELQQPPRLFLSDCE